MTRVKSRVPTVLKWYLCDDVRNEVSGKQTLIGLYSDDVIVLELPENIPDPSKETPIQIEGVAILFVVSGFAGSFAATISLSSGLQPERGKKQPVTLIAENKDDSVNLITRIRPLMVASLGEKVFTLESPDLNLRSEFRFEIRRRNVAAIELPKHEAIVRAGRKRPALKNSAEDALVKDPAGGKKLKPPRLPKLPGT